MSEDKPKRGRPPGSKNRGGRPKGSGRKSPNPKLRDRDLRKSATLVEAIAHVGKVFPKGALDIQKTIESIKVQWSDLETVALAFISLAVELLPTVNRATDALVCADRVMSILEKRGTLDAASRAGLAQVGIALRFASKEELGLEEQKKEGEQ